MRQGKTREELEENLIQPVLNVKRRRKDSNEVKRRLFLENRIMEGNVQSWLNDPERELPNLDWRSLYLFAREIYLRTGEEGINPDEYYTEVEAKKAQQYSGNLNLDDEIKLPLVFEGVEELKYGTYQAHISVKRLAQMSSTLLNYNFDIQREATKVKVGNETIKEATLMMKNVQEIKDHLKNDTLEVTNIVFNAAVGTADSGDEITYNPETKQLQINEGTVIDIVDGYHRCRASELAINEKPDIDFKFSLLILNYTDDRAANYQGQLAEQTPISKPKRNQLTAKREADAVTNELMKNSELKDRVAVSSTATVKNNELVTYDALTDAIHEQFDLSRRVEVYKVTEFLKTYFDILLGEYSEQFIENPYEWKKKSVMVDSNMFVGYITLARRMYEKNIEPYRVVDYMEKIDFSKDNKEWQDIGYLLETKRMNSTRTARNAAAKFFEQIDLK